MEILMLFLFIEWAVGKYSELRRFYRLAKPEPAIQPIVTPCKCDCPFAALLSKREETLTKEQLLEKLIGELSLTLHKQN